MTSSLLGANELPKWLSAGHREECIRLLQLALPLALQYLFSYLSLTVANAFCGHLGQYELSVVVLATSLYNVFGASILVGFSSAVETLCGICYGAKNYPKMGVLLQRALILSTCSFILVIVVWNVGVEGFLRLTGQGERISHDVVLYLRLSIPALFFYGVINCVVSRYLQSQGCVTAVTVAFGVIVLLSPLYMWLFVFVTGWGLKGAPIGTGANNFTISIALVGVLVWREWRLHGTERQMWHGWSRKAFKGFGTYLRLALPSTGMLCMSWWALEAMVLMAGVLPHASRNVAVMGICLNVSSAMFCISRGMSGAASTRVSNSLGAGQPAMAQRAAWWAITLGTGIAVVLAVICYFCRYLLVSIFSRQKDLLDVGASVFHILCISIVFDGANASVEGVVRGSGRQALAATINVVTYWGVGVTSAWVFAFPLKLGVAGFWWGRVLATGVQMVVMLAVVMFYDWEGLAESAVTVLAAPTPRITSLNPAPRNSQSRRSSISAPLLNPFALSNEERTAQLEQERRDNSLEEARRVSIRNSDDAKRAAAINIRRMSQDYNDNRGPVTPVYSYATTPSAGFAGR